LNEAKDCLLKRFVYCATGEGPVDVDGGVRKDDLRCATIELDASGGVTGLTDAVDSRFDFSARALIL
jgi:hypothetical protein